MNIGDIAKMAGVSSAAVSRYFNHRSLSEEKRAAIQKVVEETGFRPSMQARTLRTKKTNLVGVVMPRINSSAVSRMVWGILSALNEAEYHMVLSDTQRSVDKEMEYLSFFACRQVDGILLLGTTMEEKERELLSEMSVPVLIIGQRLDGFPCIYQQDFEATYELTKLALEGGSRFPCFIGADDRDFAVGKGRRQGFEKACAEKGVPLTEDRFVVAEFSVDAGREKAKELYERYPGLDALLCATDDMAVGAIQFLKEQGVNVPGQVQVAGHGDAQVSRVISPSLTTVHFDYGQTGRLAAQKLVSLIEKGVISKPSLSMDYGIVRRESTREKEG